MDGELKYVARNGLTITYIENPSPLKSSLNARKVVFVFQSLGDETSNDPDKRFPYTLLAGLRFLDCQRVYVKDDFGLAGCYGLGLDGRFDVEAAMIEFIEAKLAAYSAARSDAVAFGFSKGGYSALNLGFKCSLGSVVAAVPQTDLTDWIDNYKPFLAYIFPPDSSHADRNFYARRLLRDIEASPARPHVHLFSSERDKTYAHHIRPLVELLERKRVPFRLHMNNAPVIGQHNQVVSHSLNEILATLFFRVSNLTPADLF